MSRCSDCKYFWKDDSVGYCECTKSDDMTDEEYELYDEKFGEGCPYFEPYFTDEEVREMEEYYEALAQGLD